MANAAGICGCICKACTEGRSDRDGWADCGGVIYGHYRNAAGERVAVEGLPGYLAVGLQKNRRGSIEARTSWNPLNLHCATLWFWTGERGQEDDPPLASAAIGGYQCRADLLGALDLLCGPTGVIRVAALILK